MSLSRYFSTQQIPKLSAHARMRVYGDFLQKRDRQSTSRRSHVIKSKKIRQTSMVILSGMILLVSSFILKTETPSSTIANNIGQITQQKNTSILSRGRNIHSETIQLYDEINVGNGGLITIRMTNGFDVNVPGPANFTIVPSVESTDLGSYTIQFATSESYVAIDSITEKNSTKDGHTVSVKMGDVLFQPQRKDNTDNVSFTIDNKTSSSKVTNKGDSEILVTATDTSKNNLLNNSETAVIASAQVTEIITNGTGTDIAIVTSTPLTSGHETILLASGKNDNKENSTSIKASAVKIPTNTRTISANGKIILREDEIDLLRSNLEKSFVKRDIENIAYYHLIGNKAGGTIVRGNLLARMDRINIIIGDKTYKPAGNTIKDLIEYGKYLIKQTNNFENIPYKVRKNMEITVNRLELLKVYPGGVVQDLFSGDVQPSLDAIFQQAGISTFLTEQSIYIFK